MKDKQKVPKYYIMKAATKLKNKDNTDNKIKMIEELALKLYLDDEKYRARMLKLQHKENRGI